MINVLKINCGLLPSVCGTLFNYKTQHKRELPAWIDQLAEHVRRMEIIHVFEKPEIKGTQEKYDFNKSQNEYNLVQWTPVNLIGLVTEEFIVISRLSVYQVTIFY